MRSAVSSEAITMEKPELIQKVKFEINSRLATPRDLLWEQPWL